MQTNPLPEIDESDLKAVREFLTAERREPGPQSGPRMLSNQGQVPLRMGIARARMRSAARTGT